MEELMSGQRSLASPTEVADYLGIPERTLAQWRYLGKGPRWSKVGRHARYRWADVEVYLDEQATQGGGARA